MSDFVKWDKGKVPFYELCTYRKDVLESEARVLKMGADRYGRNNWHKAASDEGRERYTAALMRHVFALLHGEFIDPDSGLPHTAHIRVNAAFLETFAPSQSCPNDPDDRIAGRDEAHERIHDEYYSNDRKPMPLHCCARPGCHKKLELGAFNDGTRVFCGVDCRDMFHGD